MKICRVVITTALLVFVPALAANAADLFTSFALVSNTQIAECTIVNVGSSPQFVQITMLDRNGNLLAGGGGGTLEPGHVAEVTFSFGAPAGVIGAYCKFTVPDFSNFNFRAALLIEESPTGATITSIPGF